MKKLSDLLSVKATVPNNTIIRVLTITVVFVISLGAIWKVRGALILLGVAFFLALALSPLVGYLARHLPRNSRALATGITYILGFVIVGFLVYSIIPPLISQSRQFVDNFPQYAQDLQNGSGFGATLVQRYDLISRAKEAQNELLQHVPGIGGPIVSAIGRVMSSVALVISVLVLTFFMLVEGPHWIQRFWDLQPRHKLGHRQKLAARMYRVVTGYVNGQLIIALLDGTVAYIVLRLLSVNFALPIAGVVGLLALVPLIGMTMAVIFMVAIALFKSVSTALLLLIIFLVYQQIENSFIQPLVQSRAVELSPLMVLASAIIGVALAGLLGALVAIPLAACARVLVNDYIERNQLDHGKLSS